ncbi:MAG: hypothetical protein ACFB6R_07780 [Alphaproteobacteria bacterium]
MADSARIKDIVDRIGALTAGDMKDVARFGKVKGYSQDYLELKEALGAIIKLAKNVHGVDFTDDFKAIEPIRFTGLIPNEAFNRERRKLVSIGEQLFEAVKDLPAMRDPNAESSEGQSVDASSGVAAPVKKAGPRKIYVSAPVSAGVVRDITQCLITADCEVVLATGPKAYEADYDPMAVLGRLDSCQGGVVCLFNPDRLTESSGQKRVSVLAKLSPVTQQDSAAMAGEGADAVAKSGGQDTAMPSEPMVASASGHAVARPVPSEASLTVVRMDQRSAEEPAPAKAKIDRRLFASNMMLELGVIVSRFPKTTFFVVEEGMVDEVPASMARIISFKTDGAPLSFEEGQQLVQIFKKGDWTAAD